MAPLKHRKNRQKCGTLRLTDLPLLFRPLKKRINHINQLVRTTERFKDLLYHSAIVPIGIVSTSDADRIEPTIGQVRVGKINSDCPTRVVQG